MKAPGTELLSSETDLKKLMAEVTHAMMCRWTTRGHARMDMPGAKQRAAHFAERPMYDLAIRTWLAAFLQRWVSEETVVAANGE